MNSSVQRPSSRPAAANMLLLLALSLGSAPALGQLDLPDPDLEIVTWRGRDIVAGQVLVQFEPGVSPPTQNQSHEAVGAKRLRTITPSLALVRPPAGTDLDLLLEQYAARPGVHHAWPDVLHTPFDVPNDTYWNVQWHLQKVGAAAAWDLTLGDPTAIVAVLDSGVDVDHPDLAGHLAWGLDTFAGDSNPDDQDGHGTHCAGLAAAMTDNAKGVAGVARACRFAAYRCGNSTFPTSALVAAIHDARNNGALVLSMSWGSSWNNPTIRSALQAAFDDGCILVAAAGNDGNAQKFYPAALPFVISVGASKQNDGRANFSNHGSWVDIAAPGQSIYSSYKGGGYAYLSGTSMACPIVAGAAALTYDHLGGNRTPENAALVTDALFDTAVDIGSWVAHGRLDLPAALAAVSPADTPVIAAVTPSTLSALTIDPVTLTGSDFSGGASVSVDGVPASVLDVPSPTTLIFDAPVPTQLGPLPVVVTTAQGSSSPASLVIEETSPPQLVVPSAVAPGSSFAWQLGGLAGNNAYLLVAIDDTTELHHGVPVLTQFLLLATLGLDTVGLAELAVTVPHGFNGLTFHSQIVTWDGAFVGASLVHPTSIAQ